MRGNFEVEAHASLSVCKISTATSVFPGNCSSSCSYVLQIYHLNLYAFVGGFRFALCRVPPIDEHRRNLFSLTWGSIAFRQATTRVWRSLNGNLNLYFSD